MAATINKKKNTKEPGLEHKFTEEDLAKLVSFMNLVHTTAQFSMSSQGAIDYFKMLNVLQTSVIPKIKAHIFEPITEDQVILGESGE